MPIQTARLSKQQLLEKVTTAIKGCGWQYLLLNTKHPFRLRIFRNHETFTIKAYIWNLTHGGGKARPADEFRIQITGITQFETEVEGKTLILGWWNQAGVFAGFDFRKHWGTLGASPSLQIREAFLEEAYKTLGLSPCNKGNREVAIAFHPDFFIEYIRSLEHLHDVGRVKNDFDILNEVSKNPELVDETVLQKVTPVRRKAMKSVIQTIRDCSFRNRVLTSYGFKCAMCALQLDLVEAAHIVPVTESGSTDETSNGLALCTLHHRAYDRALVNISNNYHVIVSTSQQTRLKQIGHDGGMQSFVAGLRPIIHLPPANGDRPSLSYLEKGREVRHWEE